MVCQSVEKKFLSSVHSSITVLITALSIISSLSGCSSIENRLKSDSPHQIAFAEGDPGSLSNYGVLSSGSISIIREAPSVQNLVLQDGTFQVATRSIDGVPRMIGLVPGSVPAILAPRPEFEGTWLLIDTVDKRVSLKDSASTLLEAPFLSAKLEQTNGDSDEEPFTVLLKQRNPLWFAPDQYFSAREMEVPAQSSRERFLRGALGEFVVYVAENFALYSGPESLNEINGIRLSPNDMARIYYSLQAGTPVLLK